MRLFRLVQTIRCAITAESDTSNKVMKINTVHEKNNVH